MRQQTKLIFNMGAEALSEQFKEAVIRLACYCSGGCYVHAGNGYWTEGETHAERFTAEPVKEDSLVVELTTENHKLESVYAEMRQGIARLAHEYRQAVDWVHVSEIPMTGRHFSVAADLAAMTEAA